MMSQGRLSSRPAFTLDRGCPVENILTTDQLAHRPSRPPNYAGENAALVALLTQLSGSPTTVMQALSDAALALTGAHSAGISLEETDGGEEIFRWRATSGEFAKYLHGTMPRYFSPCGTVLERNSVLLMHEPARAYPYIVKVAPAISEVLLVPFYRDDKPIGTVWVISHTDDKQFDAEDRRLVTSLALFASAAVKTLGGLERLEESRRELVNAQARLTSALDGGDIGTWRWDVVNDRVYVDSQMAAWFGVSDSDADGGSVSSLMQAIHADDRERVQETRSKAIATDHKYEADYRLVSPGGRTRWLTSRARITRDVTGKALELSGVVVDITERKLLEIQQHDAEHRKTDFLAILAHELRNPLAPLQTGLELLQASTSLTDRQQIQAMMKRQIARLTRLVEDMMDVARLKSGKVQLRKSRVSLKAVIDEAVEESSAVIKGGKHTLDVDLGEDLIVDGDAERLVQVFCNLLTNAAKYTPMGGRIQVSTEKGRSTVTVRVADNGDGIDAHSLPLIFEMFAQAGGTMDSAQGGLGIGLAVVKNLTEMHGGRVHAESPGLGKGSTFVVELPLVIAPASALH